MSKEGQFLTTRDGRLFATAAIVLVALLPVLLIARRPRKIPDRAAIRAEELARLRFVAGRLTQYANKYHRPAFRFDSVAVHLDSADAAEFRSYLTDLWGDSIDYYWNFSGFRLLSDAGLTGIGREAAEDSALRQSHLVVTAAHLKDPEFSAKLGKLISDVDEEVYISAEYGWPAVATRDSMRLKRWPSADLDRRHQD
jgi:hypothetical protein